MHNRVFLCCPPGFSASSFLDFCLPAAVSCHLSGPCTVLGFRFTTCSFCHLQVLCRAGSAVPCTFHYVLPASSFGTVLLHKRSYLLVSAPAPFLGTASCWITTLLPPFWFVLRRRSTCRFCHHCTIFWMVYLHLPACRSRSAVLHLCYSPHCGFWFHLPFYLHYWFTAVYCCTLRHHLPPQNRRRRVYSSYTGFSAWFTYGFTASRRLFLPPRISAARSTMPAWVSRSAPAVSGFCLHRCSYHHFSPVPATCVPAPAVSLPPPFWMPAFTVHSPFLQFCLVLQFTTTYWIPHTYYLPGFVLRFVSRVLPFCLRHAVLHTFLVFYLLPLGSFCRSRRLPGLPGSIHTVLLPYRFYLRLHFRSRGSFHQHLRYRFTCVGFTFVFFLPARFRSAPFCATGYCLLHLHAVLTTYLVSRYTTAHRHLPACWVRCTTFYRFCLPACAATYQVRSTCCKVHRLVPGLDFPACVLPAPPVLRTDLPAVLPPTCLSFPFSYRGSTTCRSTHHLHHRLLLVSFCHRFVLHHRSPPHAAACTIPASARCLPFFVLHCVYLQPLRHLRFTVAFLDARYPAFCNLRFLPPPALPDAWISRSTCCLQHCVTSARLPTTVHYCTRSALCLPTFGLPHLPFSPPAPTATAFCGFYCSCHRSAVV